jgi:phosphatidylinositol alpha-mannosyltransferase
MKIALISPYDFAHPSGVGNHISRLEQYLTQMGNEVKIIAPASKAIYTIGNRFIRIGTPRPIPVSGSIARITTTVLRLKRCPMVGTFHASGGKPWYTMFSPIIKWYLDRWFSKLDGRICVSQPAYNYINKYFPSDYLIIPNGIDTQLFNNGVKPIRTFNDNKNNILFVGRLEKRKGFDYLLEAYRLIKPEMPDCRLIQVGPGVRLRKQYEKRVKQYKIPDVNFMGYVAYEELPAFYKIADVACFPATGWESQGLVLLEAMAVGKPVIASNIEGYTTVLTDGVEGIAVPPRNAEKLAEAILKLIKDKKLRQEMGARGKPRAQQFDWSIIAQRLMDFYTETLNRVNNRPTTTAGNSSRDSVTSGQR